MSEFTPQPIKLQGKDYLEVAQRVVWLRTDHPDTQILTERIEHDRAEGYALIRATITIPSTGGVATGYGSASRKDLRGPVAAAYLEKAETRAIGRAAAGLGYGTLAALTEDGDTLADAPIDHSRTQPAPEPPGRPQSVQANTRHPSDSTSGTAPATVAAAALISPDDQAQIRAAVSALGWGAVDCRAYLKQYNVERFSELTAEQAREVVPDLLAKSVDVQGAA